VWGNSTPPDGFPFAQTRSWHRFPQTWLSSPSISFWYAATDHLHITSGYNYLRDEASTLLTVLAFDG